MFWCSSEPRLRPPLSIPLTPNMELRNSLQELNFALHAWGYPNDPRAFIHRFNSEIQQAIVGVPSARADWIGGVECWILQGDKILDDIQGFIAHGGMMSLNPEAATAMWAELSVVAFKLFYVMAGVEFRLDQIPNDFRLPI